MIRDLARFSAQTSIRLKLLIAIWNLVQNGISIRFFIPSKLRIFILRLFGAKIGKWVYIRRGVRVHFPWNLTIGDHSWIGEQVWFINHAPIEIGSNVCISQNAIICSSGHDYKSKSLEYKHKSITIRDGAWVCLRANILAGSEIGINSVVSAGETFVGDLPNDHIYVQGKIKAIKYSG